MNENILDQSLDVKPNRPAIWWKAGLFAGVIVQAIIISTELIYAAQYSSAPSWIWVVVSLLGLGVVTVWVALREKPMVSYIKTQGGVLVYCIAHYSIGLIFYHINYYQLATGYTIGDLLTPIIIGAIWSWFLSSLVWLVLYQWNRNRMALRGRR